MAAGKARTRAGVGGALQQSSNLTRDSHVRGSNHCQPVYSDLDKKAATWLHMGASQSALSLYASSLVRSCNVSQRPRPNPHRRLIPQR